MGQSNVPWEEALSLHTVLYRWEVAPEKEKDFVDAWTAITRTYLLHGSLGSRLHRSPDGRMVAYAQWPSPAAREAAFSRGAVRPEASSAMRAAAGGRLPEIVLEPLSDVLVPSAKVRGVSPDPCHRALVTGASGTVGRALMAALEGRGVDVTPWDRQRVPIDDYHRMEGFVRDVDPDVIFHLATASHPTGPDDGHRVAVHWTSELAWIARVLRVNMVFTSSALVHGHAVGPFPRDRAPSAEAGYGREKCEAEARLFRQYPDAVVLRLGWQIGDGLGSNDMVRALHDQARAHGRVRASRRWFPACSFLSDTAEVLAQLGASDARGLYQVDANAADRLSFFELVGRLDAALEAGWVIEADDGHVQDQRLLDERVQVPSLLDRLPGPPAFIDAD
jgi:dTDP-4-dehydrorhamnose reductase